MLCSIVSPHNSATIQPSKSKFSVPPGGLEDHFNLNLATTGLWSEPPSCLLLWITWYDFAS